MSNVWTADAIAIAERVPVWTRPNVGGFSAIAPGAPKSFSPWDQPAEPVFAPEPVIDPTIQIEADAYARGFDQGYVAAATAFEGEREGLARLVESLERFQPGPPSDLANMIAETVSRLVTQIVGEVALDPTLLAQRIESVAALIEDDSATARLRLHPADLQRLEGIATPLPMVADPALEEGTIVAETANGWVEDGPAIRMERLRHALDALVSRR